MSTEYRIARFVRDGMDITWVAVDRVVFPNPVADAKAELKRLVEVFLETPEGKKFPYSGFGYGDLAEIPEEFWRKHGVTYDACAEEADLVVDNDESIVWGLDLR